MEIITIYVIGIIVGLYSTWFEYYIAKGHMEMKDFWEALVVCTFYWYIIVPWVILDYAYLKLIKDKKWPFLLNKKN